jgi:hypothetical protein
MKVITNAQLIRKIGVTKQETDVTRAEVQRGSGATLQLLPSTLTLPLSLFSMCIIAWLHLGAYGHIYSGVRGQGVLVGERARWLAVGLFGRTQVVRPNL